MSDRKVLASNGEARRRGECVSGAMEGNEKGKEESISEAQG